MESNSCDVAIVIPALNEENAIGNTLDSINKILTSKLNYRIIVVDNLSIDKTSEIAESKGAIVLQQPLRGYGSALQKGFHYAEKKLKSSIIVMLDADGSYEPKNILDMVNTIKRNEADFIIGNRFSKMDEEAMTRTNRIGNSILSLVARKLLKISITDYLCGIRAFKSGITSIFYNRSIGFPFATEMVALTRTYRVRVKEIPVSYHKRLGETKLFPYHDGARILGTTVRLLRDTRPLTFFSTIGLTLVSFGVFFGLEVVDEWLTTGIITRIPTTILSGLLVMIGVQTISLGLLSDMIKEKSSGNIFYLTEE